MEMSRIETTVELGSTERWTVRNADGDPHNFHVHDVQLVVEAVDGSPPPPELAGWKDTVYLPGNREVELLVRFTDYADPDVPYMWHCHFFRHEDLGRLGRFVVVEKGQEAGTPGAEDHQRQRADRS